MQLTKIEYPISFLKLTNDYKAVHKTDKPIIFDLYFSKIPIALNQFNCE